MNKTLIALGLAVFILAGSACSGDPDLDALGVDDGATSETPGEAGDEESTELDPAAPISVEVFVASDLDPEISSIVEQMLLLGVAEWGYSWPVEYWIYGVDEDAGVELTEEYCARRDSRGDQNYEDCFESENASDAVKGYGRYYLEIGQLAQSGDQWVGEAAWTGNPEWGTHIFMSSDPLGLSGYSGNSGDSDLLTVLHEYWHGVQSGQIESLDQDARAAADGPVWFVEGGAEFMSLTLFHKLQNDGALPAVYNDYVVTMDSVMEEYLASIDQSLAGECSGRTLLSLDSYGDDCEALAYSMGAWAIAYLVDGSSPDVLLENVYPEAEELGWEAAFEEAFGMTPEAFDVEFMAFLELSNGQKMAILDL